MSVQYKLSVEQYRQMIDAEILKREDRVELLNGEIVEMSPIGYPHSFVVMNLVTIFSRQPSGLAKMWVQSPILLSSISEPQPDVVLLRPRSDLSPESPPTPADIILLIEVADSSLDYDKGDKLKQYAEAGIADYWVANVRKSVIEAYSKPVGGRYKEVRVARRGETLVLPQGLEGSISVDEVFGW